MINSITFKKLNYINIFKCCSSKCTIKDKQAQYKVSCHQK